MFSFFKDLKGKSGAVFLVYGWYALLAFGILALFQNKTQILNFLSLPFADKTEKCPAPVVFGFSLDTVHVEPNIIRKNQILGEIFATAGLTRQMIRILENKAIEVFSPRNIQTGKNYHVIRKNECDSQPIAIVYEHDKSKYVLYDLRGDGDVRLVEKPVDVRIESAYGKIESSLWQALDAQEVNPAIIDLMEDALSSSVDFYHVQKGDEFKLIYENKYIEGEAFGVGKLIAAWYKNAQSENYSIRYTTKDKTGYYDQEGRPATKSFLKSPVKFSRISSRYNLRRFHPIKGRRIPHLGTDYAAPHGTPIRSVADGVVIAASYTSNNGNFVKIRHDKVYETQYLHMSRFAKGVRPGTRVSQGQTIGYVGSTGLATGPHVCYRFWKNGRQVNHLTAKMPPADPMSKEELPAYFAYRDQMQAKLASIGSKPKKSENTEVASSGIKP